MEDRRLSLSASLNAKMRPELIFHSKIVLFCSLFCLSVVIFVCIYIQSEEHLNYKLYYTFLLVLLFSPKLFDSWIKAEKTGKQAVEQAGKQAVEQAGKQAWKQAVEQAVEQAGKQAGKQAVEQAGKQAGKPAGEQAGKQSVEQSVEQAGKQAVKQAVKQAKKQARKQAGEQAFAKEINIAVTRSGMSSFIDSIRGLQDTDETTMEPTIYTLPNMPIVKIWVLPDISIEDAKYNKCIKIQGE